MKIDIKFDLAGLKIKTLKEKKRLAYGTAAAINDTLKTVQTQERVNLDQKFTVRKAQFMYRLIKIQTFASVTKDVPYGEVGIDSTKARVLLSMFEDGGTKQPVIGQNVAVPVTGGAARPSFGDLVKDEFTFKALGFKRINLTHAGREALTAKKRFGVKGRLTADYYIWAGKERTFILPGIGVFQRTGPGKDDIKLIYSFVKAARLGARLGFVERARTVIGQTFAKAFDTQYRKKS